MKHAESVSVFACVRWGLGQLASELLCLGLSRGACGRPCQHSMLTARASEALADLPLGEREKERDASAKAMQEHTSLASKWVLRVSENRRS